ncbi:MAG: GIY-YIG nuclease family protein [Bacteroidota bacterium]
MFVVYIIYSHTIDRFYVGSTQNLDDRMKRHNSGRSKYTKRGMPWVIITTFELASRPEAVRLEKKIKKRGIKRYLSDIEI